MEKIAASLFAMDEETWLRHANPLSVWTRAVTLLPITAVIWSRVWIGGWSLALLGPIFIWLWLNPRLFAKPASTNNWASKATFGERVLLNRSEVPVPAHHLRAANTLKGIAAIGMLPYVYGLWILDIGITLLGLTLVYAGKMWFLDRMVWLYEDMRRKNNEYASWLY